MYKANFTAIIECSDPTYSTILFNTPETSRQIDPETGGLQVCFQTTPKMSTFSLNMVISRFSYVECTSFGTDVRIYAQPDLYQEGYLAATSAALNLYELSNFLNSPFPLPALYFVAVPNFPPGVSDSWGLVSSLFF